MARCDSCNTMVSLEFGDPEPSNESYDGKSLTAEVRIVRTCAGCGQDMKEYTFSVDEAVEFCEPGDDHQVTVEAELSQLEEGGGRYQKSYFGAEGTFKLTCSCGKTLDVSWSDKVAASEMEELST